MKRWIFVTCSPYQTTIEYINIVYRIHEEGAKKGKKSLFSGIVLEWDEYEVTHTY